MAELATGLTEQDLVAMTPVPPQQSGVSKTAGTGNAALDAINAAIGKGAVNLPTQPVSVKAQAAIDVASTASAQLQQASDAAILALSATQAKQDSVFTKQQQAIVDEGAAKGVISAEEQKIAERDRATLNQTFTPTEALLAENARELAAHYARLEEINDYANKLDNAEGFTGFLQRLFVRPVTLSMADREAAVINHRRSIQAELIADGNALAAHQKALMPTKTPEQQAAEATVAQAAATKVLTNAQLVQLDDAEKHFNSVISIAAGKESSAAGEAGRQINVSYTQFNAKVHAITAAADSAARLAQLTKLRDELGGEVNDTVRIESAFNLTPGEGKRWMDRVKSVDPVAAGAILQRSYSGRAQDANALARAYMYMPPNQTTASTRITADNIMASEGKFEGYLMKAGMDVATFKKLPPEQQMSKRKEFYASSEGEIPSALLDSTTAAISRNVVTAVPDGVIKVPAVTDATGAVLRESKVVKLLPTGDLGKQLAALEGDGTAAFEAAKLAVVKDNRPPADVAKELANFFQNALTVEAAFRGNERSQFGIPHATKFPQTIKVPGYLFGVNTINVDLASYPSVLVALTKAKSAEFANAVQEGMYVQGVPGSLVESIVKPAGATTLEQGAK